MALAGIIAPWYGLFSFGFITLTSGLIVFIASWLGVTGVIIAPFIVIPVVVLLLIIMPLAVFSIMRKNGGVSRLTSMLAHIGAALVLALCVLYTAFFVWNLWIELFWLDDTLFALLAGLHALIFAAAAYAAYVMIREIRRMRPARGIPA